jgi:hypothetical protein
METKVLVIATVFGFLIGWWAYAWGRNPIVWGIFGFLVFIVAVPALLIAGRSQGRRFPCPYCREGVLDQAAICPHCKGALEWPQSGMVWQKDNSGESGGA